MNNKCCLLLILSLFSFAFSACAVSGGTKTPEQREALYEHLVALTMKREAFSSVKNQSLGVTYPAAFEPYRQQFREAETDALLFDAIVHLSNARHDRHLSVEAVDGGLKPRERQVDAAPIKLLPDFAGADVSMFVADVGEYEDNVHPNLAIGDRVIAINDVSLPDYIERIRPYHRGSTEAGFLLKLSQSLHKRSAVLPDRFYQDSFNLSLENKRGERYEVALPYLDEDQITFSDPGGQRYPNFDRALTFTSFDFYVHSSAKVVLFDWYGFRNDIVESMDEVMAYAHRHDLLDHDVIWDGTRSRGGGRGAYAIQRLQGKSFKTTFGNLRLSDAAMEFVAKREAAFARKQVMSDGSRETIDNGSWLMDWFKDDVKQGFANGQDYSNNVPFKLAHAPKYSDGMLHPAPQHFRGQLVCWLSPWGGSHLDQFASIVVDNELCPTIGMPSGGYSNTWEYEEVVHWPGTQEPVVLFMWSIGHTIRPNGQVLEGNPANVDVLVPVTSANYLEYYPTLFTETCRYIPSICE